MNESLYPCKCICGSYPGALTDDKIWKLYCPKCGSCALEFHSLSLAIMDWNLMNHSIRKGVRCRSSSTSDASNH